MKKLDITLEIDAKFGTNFQNDTAIEALSLILTAWKNFYESKNKKTKIQMWIDGKDAKYNWPK